MIYLKMSKESVVSEKKTSGQNNAQFLSAQHSQNNFVLIFGKNLAKFFDPPNLNFHKQTEPNELFKFRFSKKTEKFETIFHMIWRLLSKCQIKWEIVRMSELYKHNLFLYQPFTFHQYIYLFIWNRLCNPIIS